MNVAAIPKRQLLLGYLAATAATLGYGAGSVVGKKIVTDGVPPMVATSFSLVFGTLVVAALFHRHAISDAAHAPRRAWASMVLSGLASAWGVSFYFLGLNESPVVLVGPLTGTYPLVAIILAYLFLQRIEQITWRTVVGAALVVAGAALIAIGRG